MNIRKKTLWVIFSVILIAGLVLTAIPFVQYFGPADNSGETLPYVNVSKMETNTYIIHTTEFNGWYGESYLIIKNKSDIFKVYWLPTRHNSIAMPDLMWGRNAGLCNDFGPETVEGKIKENGLILCHDPDIEEWNKEQWRWTMSGEKLGEWTADLEEVKSSLSGHYLIVGKG